MCYAFDMNRHTFVRTFAGLSIIGFGALALLGSLDIINFGMLFGTWWPLILIWVGFLSFFDNPREFGWPGILIFAGLLFQLRELDLLNFNVWHLIWPIVIIVIGFSIVFNRSRTKVHGSTKKTDSASAFMSGHAVKNQSSDYRGGSASAIMGGIKLDLTGAKIEKEATLEVFALMGGVEVIVPSHWVIETRVTPVMGGVENHAQGAKDKKGPRLIIVGEAIMGGVEIKH